MDPARTRSRHRVLIVEDEALIAADLADALEQQGFSIVGIVGTARQARQALSRGSADLALLDIHLRGKEDGIQLAADLKQQGLPFVFLTANSDPGTLARAESVEPAGYLVKPFDERTLYATVRMALYRSQAEFEREQRRNVLISAVDRIDRPVLGLDAAGVVHWTNAAADDQGVSHGSDLSTALTALSRLELQPAIAGAMAGEAEAENTAFQLTSAESGYVLVVGPAPEAPLCLCAWCQKARGENDQWENIESVLKVRYGLSLTHGICQECVDTHFSGFTDP